MTFSFFLVDDCVNRQSRFSRLPVADDEFALSPADRNHRINGFDSGLKRLFHRFALDDARRDFFNGIEFLSL